MSTAPIGSTIMDARVNCISMLGSRLPNSARGPIVDERALYDALASGRIAGAGIDVFEVEPTPPDNPLLSLDNLIVTPHHIGLTDECIDTVAASVFSACRDMAAGRVPRDVVNPQVLGRVPYFG